MKTRMEKYYDEENNNIALRQQKNEKLYENINDYEVEDYKLETNAEWPQALRLVSFCSRQPDFSFTAPRYTPARIRGGGRCRGGAARGDAGPCRARG